jgi:hypothetical protein
MNCLCLLGRCDCGFKSHLGDGCLVCICVFLCLVRGLVRSWSLVQGVLLIVNRSGNWKEARAHKGCRASKKKQHTYVDDFSYCVTYISLRFSCLGFCSYRNGLSAHIHKIGNQHFSLGLLSFWTLFIVMTDHVQKPSNPEHYMPSSEPFQIY